MGNTILDRLEKEINILEYGEDNEVKKELLEKIKKLKEKEINILFVGGTGVGKSSTINALFNMEVAKVGEIEPETSTINRYPLKNLILWDTPGLGDDPEKDKRYGEDIVRLLKKKKDGEFLIDEVVLIIDGSNRDMGTSYEILEKIILPNINKERVTIAINQCDMVMKGRNWNKDEKKPTPQLEEVLNEKVESIKKRIYESLGIELEPIFYSALYHYNISKLLFEILKKVDEEKRFILADNLNTNSEIWKSNDKKEKYNQVIKRETNTSLLRAIYGMKKGAKIGAKIGQVIPIVGRVIGSVIGGAIGFLANL